MSDNTEIYSYMWDSTEKYPIKVKYSSDGERIHCYSVPSLKSEFRNDKTNMEVPDDVHGQVADKG